MSEKERRVSERSLENLKLGAQSRDKGKVRHNFTILPETVQWLKGTGNASDTIDALVARFKTGNLDSNYTHDGKDNNQAVSDDVYKRIEELQAELEDARSQLEKLKAVEKELRYQAGQADLLAIEWQQKKKILRELLGKIDAKQKGYLSNSFGQGIKDIRELL